MRVSTAEQNFILSAMPVLRSGDVLVVWKLDRIGCSLTLRGKPDAYAEAPTAVRRSDTEARPLAGSRCSAAALGGRYRPASRLVTNEGLSPSVTLIQLLALRGAWPFSTDPLRR